MWHAFFYLICLMWNCNIIISNSPLHNHSRQRSKYTQRWSISQTRKCFMHATYFCILAHQVIAYSYADATRVQDITRAPKPHFHRLYARLYNWNWHL